MIGWTSKERSNLPMIKAWRWILFAYDWTSNNELTHCFHSYFLQSILRYFKISHLPRKVLSFAQQSFQMLESSMIQKQNKDWKVMTEFSRDEKGIAINNTVHFFVGESLPLMEYPQKMSHSSYGPSLKCREKTSLLSQDKLLENMRNNWL